MKNRAALAYVACPSSQSSTTRASSPPSSEQAAIDATRDGFLHHHSGEWTMPAKVYLQSPPYGDFRAMPALGDGFALLKWVTSFPANLAKGLPTVNGIVCLSDAQTGQPLALLDAPGDHRAAHRRRRGRRLAGARAIRTRAPSASSAAASTARSPRAAWRPPATGRASAAIRAPAAAEALAAELGWSVGDRSAALACDIVCCITPGAAIVVDEADLRPGQHLNMLGADGSGKAEASLQAVTACELFCDEWEQASHGGELAGAVEAGLVTRDMVTPLGAVLAGDAAGRSGAAGDHDVRLDGPRDPGPRRRRPRRCGPHGTGACRRGRCACERPRHEVGVSCSTTLRV